MMPLGAINWYYYPSIRISVTQTKPKVFRSALYYLELYINGLIVQWNRLCGDAADQHSFAQFDPLKDIEAAKAQHQISNLFNFDIHFYLICWDKIAKYSTVLLNNSNDENIKKFWENVNPLTEKASKARNFFEHLDQRVQEEREGFPRGHGFSSTGGLQFKYVDISKKGKRIERELSLGVKEVKSIMKSYEDTLKSLGATVTGYQS